MLWNCSDTSADVSGRVLQTVGGGVSNKLPGVASVSGTGNGGWWTWPGGRKEQGGQM